MSKTSNNSIRTISQTLGIDYNDGTITLDNITGKDVQEYKEPALPEAAKEEGITGDQKEDYEHSRKVFKSLVDTGQDAVEALAFIAKDGDNIRAFEALSGLIKSVSDSTRELFELQQKAQVLAATRNGAKRLDESAISIDKAVFVGSTTDLLKKLKSEKENV